MPDWAPSLYLQFEDERTRPARDLLAQVPPAAVKKVVDVGCGPGNSTALLVARYPDAAVLGIDSSAAMVERARAAVPRAHFMLADASGFLPAADTDLVFANAVFHWVPDHIELFTRILGRLRRGAALAVQMPDTINEPTHQLMLQVAAEGSWADRLAGARRTPLPSVRRYYDVLRPHASSVELWHTVYNHPLEGPAAIVDWVRGTGLRPFLDRLEPGERETFLAEYRHRIAAAYPAAVDGRVLLRFPRLFIVALR